ncbi:hypothetical protein ACJDU8_17120 [Clostridium sp. WILCCON 0269]|uniref:Uncharacterized protein n=1 Tax=Candidatus Clostridium eludens TaxID=3381663 RepID=A0ABW8SRJ2_9CLOT
MPQYTIPLGKFKYICGVSYKGIFEYKETLLLIKDSSIKFLRKLDGDMNTIKCGKSLKFNTHNIDIIPKSKSLSLIKRSCNIDRDEKYLKEKTKEINKYDELFLKLKVKEFLKAENKILYKGIFHKMFLVDFKILDRKKLGLYKHTNLFLDKAQLQMFKNTNLFIDKKKLEFYKVSLSKMSSNEKLDLNIINVIKYFKTPIPQFYLNDEIKPMKPKKQWDIINFLQTKMCKRLLFKSIDEFKIVQYFNLPGYREVNLLKVSHQVREYILKEILIYNDGLNLERTNINSMSKSISLLSLCRIMTERLSKYMNESTAYKTSYHRINNIDHIYSISESLINRIQKVLYDKYIRKNAGKRVVKYDGYKDINEISIFNILKLQETWVIRNNSNNLNISSESQYLQVTGINIEILNGLIYLNNTPNKNIYIDKNINRYIEIIKRWWWLTATEPIDNIIIPNKDFVYNENLLANVDYQYLRLSEHPINWGQDLGIDWGVPTYPVSIEIMLDLVNIILEIWHSNVQGWLCCTGKESMQFIMELLYDWHSLSTSKPNEDYYRAYRWIRWEAEKVYFLEIDTGLQAIGNLVGNLIDYLKQHHFNIVPLWRNPKAMDIERCFNRMAQNNDLMKSLDKVKGKRYYYIDSQTEKRYIFGGD